MLSKLIVFTIDEQRYALHLESVERIVRAVEVTVIPKAPQMVLGVVNVQGKIIPVIDLRKRFCLPERELEPNDWFILAHTQKRDVIIVVDPVTEVIESPNEDIITAESLLPHTDYIKGIAKINGGIILINNIDKFLSLDEEHALDAAMKNKNRSDYIN
jgi:purine-binding chemotaxis protein CheW